MARLPKLQDDDEMNKRKEQLVTIEKMISEFKIKLGETKRQRVEKSSLLESVSAGLYNEVDKLAKKAPAETVTDLMLEQVNDVIRETKELIPEDTYVQRLREFVPAGDNPQLRDVIIVLRQIRQGLTRFDAAAGIFLQRAGSHLREAQSVKLALELFLETEVTADRDYFKEQLEYVSEAWLTGDYPGYFNWVKLDRLPLSEHFSLE